MNGHLVRNAFLTSHIVLVEKEKKPNMILASISCVEFKEWIPRVKTWPKTYKRLVEAQYPLLSGLPMRLIS